MALWSVMFEWKIEDLSFESPSLFGEYCVGGSSPLFGSGSIYFYSVLCSLNVFVLCYIPNLRSKDSGLHFNCPSFQSRPTSLHCWCSSLIGDYCSGGCSPMPPCSFGFEASTSAWVKDWLEAQATELYTFFKPNTQVSTTMASEINLTVGSLVSFTSTIAREFYEGRVYFYDPKDASFGIDDVSRTNVSGGYRRVEGCYQFSLKDIKDLRVIREPKLIVGSLVSFTSMTAGEFYQGTVYFYNSKDASFGIDDVSRTKFRSGYCRVEGYYQFYLEDIKDLRVIRVPVPKSTTNTNKDDQKTNPGTGASSSASTSK